MGVRGSYTAPSRGIFYEFPWENWGNWKYLTCAGLVVTVIKEDKPALNNLAFHILILSACRYLIFHIWCTLCRIPAIARKRQIQKKGMTFEQVDHEASWENMIIFTIVMATIVQHVLPHEYINKMQMWNGRGVVLAFLLHIGPVEWIYYWAHRALHHHLLFSSYHSHHHSSFVTQPITSSNHPMLEILFYHALFFMPLGTSIFLGCFSFVQLYIYILFIDFMNAWGHCNFEFVPPIMFKIFPPLKYIIYSPSFHSLHHSKVHTNFSLFMPLYDYLYGTVDSTSDELHYQAWKGEQVKPDCVYLTHMLEMQSIFHLPFGFQTFAAQPYSRRWHTWLTLPLSLLVSILFWFFLKPFVASSHLIGKQLELQTWMIPRFKFQYSCNLEKKKIYKWIERCILQAQNDGVKVVALGLLNKEHIDQTFLVKKDVCVPVVTGETLTTTIIVKKIISQKINDVFLCYTPSRVCHAILNYLCQHGVKVTVFALLDDTFINLYKKVDSEFKQNIKHAISISNGKEFKVWIVGYDMEKAMQNLASPGTHFYNFDIFSLTKYRKDCKYEPVPGLLLPNIAKTINICEDVMPRYVVRSSYAAALLHVLEGWKHNDFVEDIPNQLIDASWEALIKHGFQMYA